MHNRRQRTIKMKKSKNHGDSAVSNHNLFVPLPLFASYSSHGECKMASQKSAFLKPGIIHAQMSALMLP